MVGRFSLTLLWATGLVFVLGQNAYASANDVTCARYEAVYARGSGGNSIDEIDDTGKKLASTLVNQVGGDHNLYNLGTESYNGFQYPHVAIAGDFGALKTGAGALASSGEGYAYGKSVDQGVGELTAYLQQRIAKCQDSAFILAGYSQGAQVAGDTLFRLNTEQRAKISYVALFGNPKLYLPEAQSYTVASKIVSDRKAANPYYETQGGELLPDSCYGLGLSPWNRVIDDCHTNRGVLYTAREPFYPADIASRVHEWCFDNDGVCDERSATWGDGHTQYTADRAVPAAVNEALGKDIFFDNNLRTTADSGDIDIYMLLDGYCYAGLPTQLSYLDPLYDMSKTDAYMSGRIKFVGTDMYNGADYSYQAVHNYIETARTRGYLYFYAPPRPNAKLVFIVYTNQLCKPWFDYSMHPYSALSAGSSQILGAGFGEDYLTRIINPSVVNDATAPAGSMLSYAGAADKPGLSVTSLLLQESFTSELMMQNYQSIVGYPIHFEVRNPPADAVGFDWDFNGDGTYDSHTTTASSDHTYVDVFAGSVRTRTILQSGATSIASASVQAITGVAPQPPLPGVPSALAVLSQTDSTATLSWSTTSTPYSWRVRVDGFPVAWLAGDARSITITDLHLESDDRVVSIAGYTQDGRYGQAVETTLRHTAPIRQVAPHRAISTLPTNLTRPFVNLETSYEVDPSPAIVSPLQTSSTRPPLQLVAVPHNSVDPRSQNYAWVTSCLTVIVTLLVLAYLVVRKIAHNHHGLDNK